MFFLCDYFFDFFIKNVIVFAEKNNMAVQDGQYEITFSIWNGEDENSTPLWEETHITMVRGGIYSVALGSIVSFNDPNQDLDLSDALSFAVPYYLGINVKGDMYYNV